MKSAGLRVWIHRMPGPVNVATSPSPESRVDFQPPTLLTSYPMPSVNATMWPVSILRTSPGAELTLLDRAVARYEHVAGAGAAKQEEPLAREERLRAAPLRVDVDAGLRGEPRARLHHHRGRGVDGQVHDVARQGGGNGELAALRRAERVDEEALAAEHRAFQAGHHAAGRLRLDLDAARHARHRPGLGLDLAAGRYRDHAHRERRAEPDVDLHGGTSSCRWGPFSRSLPAPQEVAPSRPISRRNAGRGS